MRTYPTNQATIVIFFSISSIYPEGLRTATYIAESAQEQGVFASKAKRQKVGEAFLDVEFEICWEKVARCVGCNRDCECKIGMMRWGGNVSCVQKKQLGEAL